MDARVKIFLVTRISGNKSIFIFSLRSNPGILKLLLMKRVKIAIFAFQCQFFVTFKNCGIFLIRHVSIRHYYIWDCEIIKIIKGAILCWIDRESKTDIYSFTRASFFHFCMTEFVTTDICEKKNFCLLHLTWSHFYPYCRRKYSELFSANFSLNWTNKGILFLVFFHAIEKSIRRDSYFYERLHCKLT